MKIKISLLFTFLIALSVFSCQDDDKVDKIEKDTTPYNLEFGQLPPPNISPDNILTIEGVKLGRMLFYEKMLSGDGTQACASCHIQSFAFTDTAQFSTGIKGLKGKRQAMSVFNMAWHSNEFFWDGRAHLLRDQALNPIQDELEMDETLENVVAKLSASKTYKDQFKRTFGTDVITPVNISLALEQFMNSIVSSESKFDKFKRDTTLFSPSEKRGRDLFFLEYNQFLPAQSGADCAHCHGGANFENDKYMNNGLDLESNFTDKGREMVTNLPRDRAAFKVPSLRNVALTPPYMHDGRFKTLEEVVGHYNNGIKYSSSLDPALDQTRATGLRLTEQNIQDLVAFLRTLSDENLISNPKYSNPF